MSRLKRLAASLLIALLLAGTFSVTNAEAAVSKPANCRFQRWNNSSFTGCRIAWNYVSGADAYEIIWNRTDGGGSVSRRYQYPEYNVLDITGLASNRVYKVRVRAIKYVNGKRTNSAWSNLAFITPLPTKLSLRRSGSGSTRKVIASWNQIFSSAGYHVFLSTSAKGTYSRVVTTQARYSANSTILTHYRGGRFKTNQNYYVRVVPRIKVAGTYRNAPVPAGYNLGYFWFYYY